MSEDVLKTVDEQTTQVVEKRVKAGVIRRRAKKVEAPEPGVVESEKAAAEGAVASEGASAEAQLEEMPSTGEAPPTEATSPQEAAQGEAAAIPAAPTVEGAKMPTGKPVGRIDLKKAEEAQAPRRIGVVGHIEEIMPAVKEDWRERLKKGPKKRKSRAELEMEAIQRAGGLKQYAEVGETEPESEEERAAPEPRQAVQDRVFRPTPSGRRRKPVRGDFKKPEITERKAIKKIIHIAETITVAELSRAMGVKANDLVRRLMAMGTMVTVNQPIDMANAQLLAEECGFTVESTAFREEDVLTIPDAHASAEHLVHRAPVVTVMGHVDHGKTSILDVIRKSSVATGEAGGITQHIGAYEVYLPKGAITFIDTPGHEAFTSMRSRGAKVTDVVILVVAADDGVMPQTVEAINHAKAAEVPIIVAVNKIDKPNAQPERVKQQLTEHGLVAEEWGGDTLFVSTSAITGDGIEDLLEMIMLQAEMLDLKADPTTRPRGVVIEAKLSRGRGPVATVLIKEGTLVRGQYVVCGMHAGKVRAMQDAAGQLVDEATPSRAVEIQGLSGIPAAGDDLVGVVDERAAKMVVQQRQQKARDGSLRGPATVSLEMLSAMVGEAKELKLIVKSDVHGTAEAVADALAKQSTEKVQVEILHRGVGGITESDVLLASASQAVVIGFNVSPDAGAKRAADEKGVDIKTYRVIYEMIDDVRKAMAGLLAPKEEQIIIGHAEVRNTFKISKVGTIAGCYVTDGKIQRNARARLLRDQAIVFEGTLSSLKRFKDDAREVGENYECGIGLENFNDVKIGDVIEAYIIEKTAATL